MYNYNEIREIHLELTSKCQASCPMCPRNIQGGISNPWLIEDEITIDQFKEWFDSKFIKQLTKLYMCGNLGDPIIGKDCLEIFQYVRSLNSDIKLVLHTNGSARSKEWWKNLSKEKVDVVFGIDGLEDTHHLYRIGTDFKKIIKNATAFINEGGNARWHMLVFDHNKDQVEACKQLSKELGFIEFTQKNSSRFRSSSLTVLTKDGKTSHVLYPSEKSLDLSKKVFDINLDTQVTIKCKAKSSLSIYVSADGSVTPCCWLNYSGYMPNHPNLIDYNDKGFITPNLNDVRLEEIFNKTYFTSIENTWNFQSLKECNKQCGLIDKLNEQFK
jgi:MoaA/NifB/PqqE/SkfB family radical SAM enzyme